MVLIINSSYIPKQIYQLKQRDHYEQGTGFISRNKTKFMLQVETNFCNHTTDVMYI